MTSRKQRGFTLMEMMVVVAVIGVLSAIAIPTYLSYLQRSRVAEAVTFLAEIKQRQEAYRAEFGQYCAVDGSASAPTGAGWNPATMPSGGSKGSFDATMNPWPQLGAVPDGLSYFQYRSPAGAAGTTPTNVGGYDGSDFWFIAQARGDLDGDGDVMIVEAYSHSNHLYYANGSMGALNGNWD